MSHATSLTALLQDLSTAEHRLVAADLAEEMGRVELAAALRSAPKRATPERTIRITTTSNTGLPNAYGYARHRLRVVECLVGQNGWRSERGVRVLWESDHYAAHSRGPKSRYQQLRREAEAIRDRYLLELLAV